MLAKTNRQRGPMPRNWTRIILRGNAQVIPATCPNCLGPASGLKLRSAYKGLEGWLTRTTYYQTFQYCATCHPQAVSAEGLRRWVWVGLFLGFVTLVAAAAGVPALLGDPVTHVCTPVMAKVGIALSGVVALATVALTYLAARAIKRSRHPLLPTQAVWGRAAFYAGKNRLGTEAGTAVYLAARKEWLAALARANPEQVDEATYRTLTGEAKPQPGSQERPFGSA